MNKKILFAAPAIALGMAGLVGPGDSFATEGITTGNGLHECLEDKTQSVCNIDSDFTMSRMWTGSKYDASVDVAHSVVVHLNGHKITSNIPIDIEGGNLSFSNEGEKDGEIAFTNGEHSSKPQFELIGTNDKTKEEYSVLNLNGGVKVSSTNNTYSAIRINTGDALRSSNDRSYGSVVNIHGANLSDIKTYAIYIDDSYNRGINGAVANNATIINIDENSKINSTKTTLVSNVFANWNINNSSVTSKDHVITSDSAAKWSIEDATLSSTSADAIQMSNGQFTIGGDNTKISTNGEGAAVINVTESGSTNEASITINNGAFQSTGENGVFYKDSNVNYQKTIGSIEINDGAFTASDLFNTGSHFNEAHKGFITGGTWGQRWDDRHDNGFVASGYLKDFDESVESSKIMTVIKPTIEGLPEGYTIELSRRTTNDTELLKSLLEKAGVKGTALNQYIEANLYDATGTISHELPDGAEGVTLKISGFNIPELQDGISRKYYIIAIHATDDPENPEIYPIETTYNAETDEITLPNLTKFSYFGIAYEDTEIPTPAPASEPTTTPTTPETGAETAQTSGIVASTLALCMLTGATIAAFIGRKLFRKK